MLKRSYVSKKKLIQVGIAAAVALVVAALISISLHTTVAGAQAANTLKVSPVRSDLEIEPGQSKTIQAVVTNTTNSPITVRPVVNDFVSGDESGTPALILDDSDVTPTRSLKRFISPMQDVTIPANKAATINVVITVPQNAMAGGYFGAVRFAPTSPDGGGQVNMSASVASLVLLTVPGDVVERLELTNFGIQQGDKQGTVFRTGEDLKAVVRFQNKGGIQIGPFGTVAVKKGDKIVYETTFNNKQPRDMVLPDGARKWEIPLDKVNEFGFYEVIATFTYGKTNQTIEVNQSFWVIPWSVIIAALIALVLLAAVIIGVVLLVKSRKRRNGRRPGATRIRRR